MKMRFFSAPPSIEAIEAMCEVIEMKLRAMPVKFSSLGLLSKDRFISDVLLTETKDPEIWDAFFREHFSSIVQVLVDRNLVGIDKIDKSSDHDLFYVALGAHGEYIQDSTGEYRFVPRDNFDKIAHPADLLMEEDAAARAWRWFRRIWRG